MESKYNGIDQRDIKCCCDNPNCCEAGISIDENCLKFHFLEYIPMSGEKIMLTQTTKSMMLNKENVNELIKELKQLKF